MVLMAPRDEAMLVHMLRTATLYDDGPIALRYPRGEAEGVPIPARPKPIEIGRGEVLREGERVALLGYGLGVPLALGGRRARGRTASTSRWPTRASPSRSTPSWSTQLAAEHDLLVTIEDNVLPGRLRLGGGRAPARPRPRRRRAAAAPRSARPLRHARQAGAAARGGRHDAGPDRRAGRRRPCWTRATCCRAPRAAAAAWVALAAPAASAVRCRTGRPRPVRAA